MPTASDGATQLACALPFSVRSVQPGMVRPLFKKVTVPVMEPGGTEVTSAVKVTGSPKMEGFSLDVMSVVVGVFRLKVAVTVRSAFMTMPVRVAGAVPVPAPVQLASRLEALGVPVRVTVELSETLKIQVPGQLIPAGMLVMVPAPVPSVTTVRV